MKSIKHALNEVWNKFPEATANNHKAINMPKLERYLADVFAMGKSYYYVLDVAKSTIGNFHPDILIIHSLKEYPNHLKEIIDLIHPEDLPFVMQAENWTLETMSEIGFEHQLNLKSCYCFRMKVSAEQYELFHHQAIHITKDENGRLLEVINIHTNINHITKINNFIATVNGIGYRNDFFQKVFIVEKSANKLSESLTRREKEIILLLIKGHNDKEIAAILCVSYHTVRTHHKNILGKTKSKNSFELLKQSLENGFF